MAYKDILPQSYAQLLALATNANYTPNFEWVAVKNDISGSTFNNKSSVGAWFYIKVTNDAGGDLIDGRANNFSGQYNNTATVLIQTLVKINRLNIQTKDADYEDGITEGLIQEDILTAFSRIYDELCTASVRNIEYLGTQEVIDEVDHGERAIRLDFIFNMSYEQNRYIK